MKPEEVTALMSGLKGSVQMRTTLRQRLGTNEEVDLVGEWHEVEQLDPLR